MEVNESTNSAHCCKRNKSKLSKAEFADAMELTKFALAALEDKNSELAAERLQQALEVLNQR